MQDGEGDRRRFRSFVLGGLVGASAMAAARRRAARRRRGEQRARGLSAFESAPCYRESVERSHADAP